MWEKEKMLVTIVQDWQKMLLTLSNDKNLHMTKLKAFADNSNFASMMISLLHRAGNTVGKGENAGYQHFLLFLQCFPKPPS